MKPTSDKGMGHRMVALLECPQSLAYESRYPPSTISMVPVT